jgi:hypothetical protein
MSEKMPSRPLDEQFDTQMEVERNPCGAWQAIQTLADRIEALEAQLAESRAGLAQWQPIETAPKDGGSFLAWVPENKCVFCVVWREDIEYPWGGDLAIFGGDIRDFLKRATHWMPLPPPPGAALAKIGGGE